MVRPFITYFFQLLEIMTHLASSGEAMSGILLKNHIYRTLPSAYPVTIEIPQLFAKVTDQEVIDTSKECELNGAMIANALFFLCYFLCDPPWCTSTFFRDRPGRRAKWELATSRHRADSGEERTVHNLTMI